MSKSIKIGDRVSLLDENVKGTVLSITGDEIIFVDSDGFERLCQKKELIIYDTELILDSSSNTEFRKKKPFKQKKKVANPNVIDLHSKNKYINPNEILKNQLVVLKAHLNRGIRARQPKLIFIHGEGEGILRKNIEQLLFKNKISFSDAPYHEFGHGAIEVYLTGIRKLLN